MGGLWIGLRLAKETESGVEGSLNVKWSGRWQVEEHCWPYFVLNEEMMSLFPKPASGHWTVLSDSVEQCNVMQSERRKVGSDPHGVQGAQVQVHR